MLRAVFLLDSKRELRLEDAGKIISTDRAQEMQKGSCRFQALGSHLDFYRSKNSASDLLSRPTQLRSFAVNG
jgi:hypothetical protein